MHALDPSLDIIAPSDGSFVPGVQEATPGDPTSQVPVSMPALEDNGAAGHEVEPPTFPVEVIPAVSHWGMIVLAVLIIAAGAIVVTRRRAATARA